MPRLLQAKPAAKPGANVTHEKKHCHTKLNAVYVVTFGKVLKK
jgi:hypothetical protein